jgi:hypothetical protein
VTARVVPPSSVHRPVAVALWVLVVIGVVADVRLMLWYWPGSIFDGLTSSVWTGLAWDFAHGEFYRPLLGPGGYGGTRYMPLFFVAHGLLIRAHVDPVFAGVLVMQTTVLAASLALFAALRSVDVPTRLAMPLAGTVWSTVIYQKYCTDVRADYLAAAFALAAVALAGNRQRRPLGLVAAAAACALGGLTKVTAVAFSAPITLRLFTEGRRVTAAQFALGTTALFGAALGFVQFASGGSFLENFRTTLTGGMKASDVWHAAASFVEEVGEDPFLVAPFALACWCWATTTPGRRALAHAYFVTATLVTLVILASPGTGSNHLVDLHMASTLVIGVALHRGEISRRAVTLTYAILAVVLAAISWPVPGMPSVIATLRTNGPRRRATVEAIRAEFLPPSTVYLSTDPLVSVLNNEHPLMLDAFNLTLLVREGTPAGRDLEDRVRRRVFGAIILRENDELPPRDMNPGDSGFDEFRRQFWVHRDDALTRVFQTAYEMRAVRTPFVILVPVPPGS